MPYETLLLERSDAYAVVTLNRPKVMNALNRTLFSELDDVFTSLAIDRDVRAIILTGAGEKAFAAGADINELAGLSAIEGQQMAQRGQAVFRQDRNLRQTGHRGDSGLRAWRRLRTGNGMQHPHRERSGAAWPAGGESLDSCPAMAAPSGCRSW